MLERCQRWQGELRHEHPAILADRPVLRPSASDTWDHSPPLRRHLAGGPLRSRVGSHLRLAANELTGGDVGLLERPLGQ
jgi:hypothetical protein